MGKNGPRGLELLSYFSNLKQYKYLILHKLVPDCVTQH